MIKFCTSLYKYSVILILFSVLILACGGGDSGGDDDTPPTPTIPSPSATSLVFPENNTECNEGVVINNTQSTVTFRWNASQNTDTYEVNVRNLNTNNTSKTNSNKTDADITINRGVPYEWFVISKASGTNETAQSPTFRFYNQGPGIENYAPFPAEAVTPERGSTISATGTINLQWSSSDIDNDIIEFDVLFGTNSNPTTVLGSTTTNQIEANISSGQVYYWRVISKDGAGNNSTSEVFEFRVN